MKRTCNRCKAPGYSAEGTLCCDLGYKTRIIYYKGIEIGLIPLEECPKPITYSNYFYALKFERKDKRMEK